jgi:cytochrome b561
VPLRNNDDSWGAMTRVLHWLIAVAIIAMMVVGVIMHDMPNSPDKFRLYALHKATGITILAFVFWRIVWRLTNKVPLLPGNTPYWQQRVSAITHFCMYALMVIMPLSGWLMNSASGFPMTWYGFFEVPALVGADDSLKETAKLVHEFAFIVLGSLVILHVAAAVQHQFLLRDGLLKRMWSGRS